MKNPGKRGRKPDDPYTMWLCYHLARIVDEDTEPLPQHKQREGTVGAYALVGNRLNLSPETVDRNVGIDQKLRDTADGLQKYYKWLNEREQKWWCYHAVCVERRELKLLEYVGEMEGDILVLTRGDLRLTPKEVEASVNKAQELLNREKVRGNVDYEAWLDWYERRIEKARVKPLVYRLLPSDDPAAIAINRRRADKGLRNGLTKAGRPPKRNN